MTTVCIELDSNKRSILPILPIPQVCLFVFIVIGVGYCKQHHELEISSSSCLSQLANSPSAAFAETDKKSRHRVPVLRDKYTCHGHISRPSLLSSTTIPSKMLSLRLTTSKRCFAVGRVSWSRRTLATVADVSCLTILNC